MATKGEEIAAEFEQANAELIATIEGMTPEQWARQCGDTGWTVGVQAHHLAEGHRGVTELVANVARGQEIQPFTPDILNAANAEHAERAASVTREETLQLARENGEWAARTLRELSDDELQRTLTVQTPAGPQEMSAEGMARRVVIGHIGMHLPGIKEAIAG